MDPDWGEFLARRRRDRADAARRTWPRSLVAASPARALRDRVGVDRDDGPRPRRRVARRRGAGRLPAHGAPDGEEGTGASRRGGRRRRSASRRSRPRARPRSPLPRRAASASCRCTSSATTAITDELIAEAIDAGFTAVFLTVDLPVLGPRDRERRIHWTFDDDSLPAVAARGRRGRRPARRSTCSTRRSTGRTSSGSSSSVYRARRRQGRSSTREDAVLAAEHGAAGIVVSNHGGRQLDGAMPTLEALPGDRRRGRRPPRGAARRRHPARHRRRDRRSRSAPGRARRPDAAVGPRRRRGGGSARRCSSCLREELAIGAPPHRDAASVAELSPPTG